MRPEITIESIGSLQPSVLRTIFEGVAEAKHYKALYVLQRDKNIHMTSAIRIFFEIEDFMTGVRTFLKDDANYRKIFTSAITNLFGKFTANDIPLRNCDFKVKDGEATSWFYIDERVEINFSGSKFYMHRLMVDPRSNIIVYSDLQGDRPEWNEYDENGTVGIAYKEFLAERELLS